METDLLGRRKFLAASAGAIAAVATGSRLARAQTGKNSSELAILGGQPIRKNKSWPSWPHVDEDVVNSVLNTTKSGIWCRIQSSHGTVPTFEKKFAEMEGATFCVCTGAGTQSLHTSVEALGIGAGDEVITSPYTDPGTIASILAAKALPVLADLDPESFQMDPEDTRRRITQSTKAIMPVHIMGQPCNMDRFMEIAKEHRLKVIEDACQAHLAEFRGKKLGTIGDLGCFSFQTSKTIACGEGGAILGNDEQLMDRCYTIHNHGTSRRGRTEMPGPKYRMNEFEAAVLLGQLPTAQERFELRNKNANYLSAQLKGFEGITPQKLYEGTESGAWYLYGMSYHKEHFNGASRSTFLKAVAAEGIGLSSYIRNGLHREPWIDYILGQRIYQEMFSQERLESYRAETACPNCDRVCQEMVMFWSSGMLLGTEQDMDDIANAIFKVHENRDQLQQIEKS
ncbi:MAG: DegT/DnrJ/EryC1/StrS family aminotransferase [Pirellulales bacterium]|nr:DegT/DnrJ/EryC1/StrS family aminotransferase [Pirellulales bacterium]